MASGLELDCPETVVIESDNTDVGIGKSRLGLWRLVWNIAVY